MSWVDRRKDGFIINTGDGKRYEPKTIEFGINTEYQLSTFEFINVAGSLVVQSQPIGNKYPAKLYFDDFCKNSDGLTDHLEITAAFRKSCTDTRPWTIEHPLYDIITVKVAGIEWDDSAKNLTVATCTLLETIIRGLTAGIAINPIDQIPITFELATEKYSESFKEVPLPGDINRLREDNNTAFSKGVPVINLTEEYQTYYNAFNTASSYIDTATETPLLMMRSTINLLTMPARFQIEVGQRIALLNATFLSLRANLLGFTSVSAKQLYAAKAGSVISAMCLASATPLLSDFKNSSPILIAIDTLIAARNQYIADLDTLQTANAGNVTSFVVDATSILAFQELVNLSISALYTLSLSAKSENLVTLNDDACIITLTHRFYGLDINDTNLNDFYDANAFTLNEHIIVPKGRKVVYYA